MVSLLPLIGAKIVLNYSNEVAQTGFFLSNLFPCDSMKSESQDPVHILGYYSSCGPMRCQELERALARIREGRYHRAKTIVSKLMSLKKPVEWARVIAIAGAGVAPGRVHIARALVEAGHVYNLREAFNKYLYDGGPAYAP